MSYFVQAIQNLLHFFHLTTILLGSLITIEPVSLFKVVLYSFCKSKFEITVVAV